MRDVRGIFLAIACSLAFGSFSALGQEHTTPSAWLDRLDREHNHLVSKGGHVHARGHVQAVDTDPGTVTIRSEEMESPDKSIWMPAMEMLFHVTNRRMLHGLRPGDAVEFEATRLRNAVMITNIRKAR